MTMNELAEWLESRDHQVTVCFCVDTQGLHIKMIDMKTGMAKMGIIYYLDERSISNLLELTLDKMYQELMDALGRGERSENHDTEI